MMASNSSMSEVSHISDLIFANLIGNLYLPPKHTINMKYLRDLVTGEKLALNKRLTITVQVLRYKELQAKCILAEMKKDPKCMAYVPEHWLKEKAKISRAFLWTILATVRSDYAW
jgi:hypothetical protein